MNENCVYFRVDYTTKDGFEEPFSAYGELNFGLSDRVIPYDELVKAINVDTLAKLVGMPADNITFVTKEAYDEWNRRNSDE